MRAKIEYPAIFTIGSLGYGSMELIFRGHTHWSMFLLGGIVFFLLYQISNFDKLTMPEKWLVGAIMITGIEFFAGGLLNMTLDWRVWTYSKYPMNVMGQICILFSLLWFFMCIPACRFCILLKTAINKWVKIKR